MADTDRRHDDDVLDERAIREDERARMEHDLRTLDEIGMTGTSSTATTASKKSRSCACARSRSASC